MSIFTTLAIAVRELAKASEHVGSGVDRAKNALKGPADGRYLERPVDSVFRKAKDNILLYPIIVSESISPDVAATIAKATQVRAAEYTRLMIANMDALVDAGKGGSNETPKANLMRALRGGTLGEDVDQDAVNAMVRRKGIELVEAALMAGGLRAPLEQHLINEGKEGSRKRTRADKIRDAESASDEDVSGSTNDDTTKYEQDQSQTDGLSQEKAAFHGNRSASSDDAHKAKAKGFRATAEQINKMAGSKDANERLAAAKLIAQRMEEGDQETLGKLTGDAQGLRDLVARLPKDGYALWANSAKHANNINIEQANRWAPTLLDLTIMIMYGESRLPVETKLTLGIKCPLHQAPSLDLMTSLGTALQRDSFTLQFFRMFTGETTFLKDFVLNLKNIKARTVGQLGTGAKLLEKLRKQAEWNVARQSWFVKVATEKGFVPPTATLAVTADEVVQIKSLYRTDFGSLGTVREFMRAHNLLGFMIVDEAIGLVRMYDDGSEDFDRLPLSELKRQSAETSIKDVLKIMATR